MMKTKLLLGSTSAAAAAVVFSSSVSSVEACSPTPSDIEGPFWQSECVPFNDTVCEPGVGNNGDDVLIVSGRLLSSDTCAPSPSELDAYLEVWQADAGGEYDAHDENHNHNCRARVPITANGTYTFTTTRPGEYNVGSGVRPGHLHLKVVAVDPAEAAFSTLTTQLYFGGDPTIESDFCGGCNSENPLLQLQLEGGWAAGHVGPARADYDIVVDVDSHVDITTSETSEIEEFPFDVNEMSDDCLEGTKTEAPSAANPHTDSPTTAADDDDGPSPAPIPEEEGAILEEEGGDDESGAVALTPAVVSSVVLMSSLVAALC